ncbi:SRPBCC family protein [Jatrophihabitans sp. YIM 134969]
MELEHSFTVPVGIDRAWEVLLDVETIAPCMPGAALDTVDGDAFTGTVKVKLGPIGLTYKGKASFVEKDETAHRAVIDAQGRDARGNGTANAKVTATLEADGDTATKVVVSTDLAITGKPAQFGRGVMVDVGNKLIGQFADCLAGKLSADEVPAEPAPAPEQAGPAETSAPVAESTSTATSTATAGAAAAPTPTAATAPKHAAAGATPAPAATGPRKVAPVAAAEPIDLMASAGPAVAKRVVPLVAGIVVAVVAFVLLRRRR